MPDNLNSVVATRAHSIPSMLVPRSSRLAGTFELLLWRSRHSTFETVLRTGSRAAGERGAAAGRLRAAAAQVGPGVPPCCTVHSSHMQSLTSILAALLSVACPATAQLL